MAGSPFLLVSKHSGFALSAGDSPGAAVIVNTRNEHDPRQLWFEDGSSGTIRNQATQLCLHVGGDNILYLKPVEHGQDAQQWKVGKDVVHHRNDKEKVFDLCRGSKEVGAQVCAWKYHGGTNQQWEVIHLKPKFFYIKSELSGKVLDIEGQNPAPGSKIIMWDQKRGPTAVNQLWYTDQQGIIRSKLNDLVIDASHEQIETQPFDPNNPKRAWIVNGSFIAQQANRDMVLDIMKSDKESGAHICAWKQHGGPNQKWIIESE